MAKNKSLRFRVDELIGPLNTSAEARAIYMLVDKIEVIEKQNKDLQKQVYELKPRIFR